MTVVWVAVGAVFFAAGVGALVGLVIDWVVGIVNRRRGHE